jgi:hypothetical protein
MAIFAKSVVIPFLVKVVFAKIAASNFHFILKCAPGHPILALHKNQSMLSSTTETWLWEVFLQNHWLK